MKFTPTTLEILKNFSTINPSLVFNPGNRLRTMSPSKSVLAAADIDDDIPSEACIYDLTRFLAIYSLYEDPEVEFKDKFFVISQGRKKTKYYFADKSMVFAPPAKEVKLPTQDVIVDLPWKDLNDVVKAAGIFGFPEISFVGSEGKCFLRANNPDENHNSTDSYGVEIGDTDKEFVQVVKVDNLRMLQKDYKLTMCFKGYMEFKFEGLSYLVATEAKKSMSK